MSERFTKNIILVSNTSGGGGSAIAPSGFVSATVYLTVAALESDYPAASNLGNYGLAQNDVGLVVTYMSDGTTWLAGIINGTVATFDLLPATLL